MGQREWAAFEFKNPFGRTSPEWPRKGRRLRMPPRGAEIVLASAGTRRAEFVLPSSDWRLLDAEFRDREGNAVRAAGWEQTGFPVGGRYVAKFWRGLETNRTWQASARFVRDGNPERPYYRADERRKVSLTANHQERRLTNNSGEVFGLRFDGQVLEMRRKEGLGSPLWVALGATNENGEAVAPKGSHFSARDSRAAVKRLELSKACNAVDLELACPLVVEATFYVKPGDEAPVEERGSGAMPANPERVGWPEVLEVGR